jgi:hypothetical protein
LKAASYPGSRLWTTREDQFVKVPESEEDQPIAWTAILADTPVYASDGGQVGVVNEVLGSQGEDIFHGIVVRSPARQHNVAILADRVSRISRSRIDTSLTTQEIRALPVYKEEASYSLGMVGRLRKHVGWKRDDGSGPT